MEAKIMKQGFRTDFPQKIDFLTKLYNICGLEILEFWKMLEFNVARRKMTPSALNYSKKLKVGDGRWSTFSDGFTSFSVLFLHKKTSF